MFFHSSSFEVLSLAIKRYKWQLSQVPKDVNRLRSLKEKHAKDPFEFLRQIRNKEFRYPEGQKTLPAPTIEWSKYHYPPANPVVPTKPQHATYLGTGYYPSNDRNPNVVPLSTTAPRSRAGSPSYERLHTVKEAARQLGIQTSHHHHHQHHQHHDQRQPPTSEQDSTEQRRPQHSDTIPDTLSTVETKQVGDPNVPRHSTPDTGVWVRNGSKSKSPGVVDHRPTQDMEDVVYWTPKEGQAVVEPSPPIESMRANHNPQPTPTPLPSDPNPSFLHQTDPDSNITYNHMNGSIDIQPDKTKTYSREGSGARDDPKAKPRPLNYNIPWSDEEQRLLEQLLDVYPDEPVAAQRFQKISLAMGTRTPKQVASRVQKYFIKLVKAGLEAPGRMNYSLEPTKPKAKGASPVAKTKKRKEPPAASEGAPSATAKGKAVVRGKKKDDTAPAVVKKPKPKASVGRISGAQYLYYSGTPSVYMSEEDDEDSVQDMMAASTNTHGADGITSHIGFACDSCGVDPILGTRYSCVDCEVLGGVDLCGPCYNTGYQTEYHLPSHQFHVIEMADAPSFHHSVHSAHGSPGTSRSAGVGSSNGGITKVIHNARFSTTRASFKAAAAVPSGTAPTQQQPVSALILKPFINFKALSHPETASAMAINIQQRNLPSSISVASINELHRIVADKTHQLDKARSERNKVAAEMKELFNGGNAAHKGKKKKVNDKEQQQQQQITGMTREEKEKKRQELVERGKVLKEDIHAQEAELAVLEARLYDQAVLIPNSTHPTTPIGPESAARLVRVQGVPRLNQGIKAFAHPGIDTTSAESNQEGALAGITSDYPLLDHVALSKSLDLVDFEAATAVTGSRWYYLKNEAALLELALIQFATQRAVKAGFTPVITPDVVRPEVVQACGFQPRDEASQTYWVTTTAPGATTTPSRKESTDTQQHHQHSALCLVATAEIALAGMNMNKVLDESQLPMRLAGFGRAFRAEAGSRGAEAKGLYRVHQFSKVELFVVSKADQDESDKALESIRQFQEDIFEELGLCYRVLDMPTEELGASAYKKYDIEAWMPGRNGWGEISSTSNCTDYQARRLNIRYRTNKIRTPQQQEQVYHTSPSSSQAGTGSVSTSNSYAITEFAHTLNGTAMAIPRIIVALLETFQTEDGSIHLPECLWPFMAGVKVIQPKGHNRQATQL
ncbi:seryl-tRNA synthetase [Podila epigama]|nr:seryl-tRNA synthetase [Podila epigama]